MRRRAAVFLKLWCLLLAASGWAWPQDSSTDALDIQIVEAKWGFDGFSRNKTFVPLRIVIRNRSATQKTVLLRLSREDSIHAIGESLEQEVIISAETTRVAQMTPFVSDPGDTWTLRWGETEAESLPIKSDSADDGVVFIAPPQDLFHRTGSLPVMREDEFPTSITQLDALRVVFLDQEPRWTGARRKSFEEWLLKGGKVIILNTPDGGTPTFANGFEYLNVAPAGSGYGMGLIQRFPLSAQQVSRKAIEKEILERELTGGNLEQKLAVYNSMVSHRTSGGIAPPGSISMLSYSRDKVLSDLKDLAQTRQQWGVIYLAVFAYVGWQWRIGWRWGLMEKRPGRFYAWMLGLALGFSSLFMMYGQIGSKGNDRAVTVAIARRLNPGLYDVEGWSVLGTGLNGGEHQFAVPGTGQLYGGGESFGQHPMLIRDSQVLVDLTAFSTQKIAFRSRLEMPDIPFQLQGTSDDLWQTKSSTLTIDPAYKSPVYAAVVVIDNKVYEFTSKSGQLVPTENMGGYMELWLNSLTQRTSWRTGILSWLFDTKTAQESYMNAFQNVVGNGFNVGTNIFHDSFTIPRGYARVMLYTDLPSELKLSGDFPDQAGRMLYVTDVPLTGGQ